MGTRLRAQGWSLGADAAPCRVRGAAGWMLRGDYSGPGCPRPTLSPGPPLLPGWPGKPCGNKAGIKPCAQRRRQRPCPVSCAWRQHPCWVLALHPGTTRDRDATPRVTGYLPRRGAPTLPYSQLVPGVPAFLGGRPVPRRPARDRDVTVWQRKVQK